MAGFPHDSGKPTDPIEVTIRGAVAARIRAKYHASQVGTFDGDRTTLGKYIEEIIECHLATSRPEPRITHEAAWERNSDDLDYASV